jgi:hypothetical protein
MGGLARLYQSKHCMIDYLASATESYACKYTRSYFTDFHRHSTNRTVTFCKAKFRVIALPGSLVPLSLPLSPCPAQINNMVR